MASEEFDYVVIGGGSAGCVVAGRLSEDPSVEVALIEAGPPDSDPVFTVPARFWQQQKSAFDWDFETEPEPGFAGRRGYLPRGKVLGGTSSMNTMLYVRGDRADYDGWERSGCAGWSYEDVLPLFRRSEDNQRGEDRYHGVGGPLRVEDAAAVPSLLRHWVAAAVEAGHPENEDFNGASQDGVGVYQVTQRDGARCSSATAFVSPHRERSNLTVLSCTQALRLLWSGTRAVGVEVEFAGEVRTIRFAREAIVAAGAYLSPALLMHSGLGPAEHLRAVGIEPLLDNPAIGSNLRDHLGCFLTYPTRIASDVDPASWVEAGGFAKTDSALQLPDVQFHAAPGSFGDEGVATGQTRAISFGPYGSRPKSRGWVRLRSGLPQAKPLISHNFLDDPDDLAVLGEGVRMAMRIARQDSLRELIEDTSGLEDSGHLPRSEESAEVDAYIRANAFSFYHPVGTCAIGTVVDPELRVHGVEGVRVCDTSVMPTLIGGNTNAPAIMVGEKLAGLLRKEVP